MHLLIPRREVVLKVNELYDAESATLSLFPYHLHESDVQIDTNVLSGSIPLR